jgi:hypothetical protein
MNAKTKIFKNKWLSYNNQANKYNNKFSPEVNLPTPTFDDVKSFDIENPFWSIGSLDHRNEPWAVNSNIQDGIQAVPNVTHCTDELRRISREARQAVKWAVRLAPRVELVYDTLRNSQ